MPDAPRSKGTDDRTPTTIWLWASRWGWVNGVIGVALGLVLLGVVALLWYHSLRAEPPADQGVMIGGSVAATPGLLAIGGAALATCARLFQPRRGRIDLLDDRMVIHDRWMLRRPMVINRADVTEIESLPWRHVAWRLPLSDDLATKLRPRSVLLDYGTTPNVAIHFRNFRTFPGAVRTPQSRVGFNPISRGRLADSLLVRVTDPDRDVQTLDRWMATSPATPRSDSEIGSLAGCLGGCITAMVISLWAVITIGGVIAYAVGAGNNDRPDRPERPVIFTPPADVSDPWLSPSEQP